jgi:RND family efflux transporter MFP subunit
MRILPLVIFMALALVPAAGCAKKPKLKAVAAAETRVESTVSTISSGSVDAEQQAILGFASTGRVSRIHVKVGDTVKQGQVLAELDNSDLKIIARDAEQELKRTQKLYASRLVSKVALDEAKKNFEVARANQDRSTIVAPFDGMVTELNLEIGESAQATANAAAAGGSRSPLRLVDLKPRLVKGDIDEVDLSKVKVGAPARVKILAVRPEPFEATVDRVVPFVNTAKEQDRTSEVLLRLRDEGGAMIPVGASADIEILTASKDHTLAVPTRVILGFGTQRYVYEYRDGRIYKTPITVGIGNYSRTEVVKGLHAGSVVIYPPEDIEISDGMKVDIERQTWP